MPNVGSWNGKWSGEGNKYYIIHNLGTSKKTQDKITALLKGKQKTSWYYGWSDGWGANVTMEIIDVKEARKRRKESKGFCGYDWMVTSILKYDKILATHEEKEFLSSSLNPIL